MVLMSPVLVVSAVSTILSLLELVVAPRPEETNQEACLDAFNNWFGPSYAMGAAASNSSAVKLVSAAACMAHFEAVQGSPSPRVSRSSTSADTTLNEPSPSLHRLTTPSARISQASAAPLASPGCTERACSEHQLREAQGSPRPSASGLGIQGVPEVEAVAAGLCALQLPSCLASPVTQGGRAAPAAACGAPQQVEAMPTLRHVVVCPRPAEKGEEEALLCGTSTVKALVGVWEMRGNKIREQLTLERKLKALRPYRSLPARLD